MNTMHRKQSTAKKGKVSLPFKLINASPFIILIIFLLYCININNYNYSNNDRNNDNRLEREILSSATTVAKTTSSSPKHELTDELTDEHGHKQHEYKYPHDDPKHPWHWSRETIPTSQQFSKMGMDCGGKSYEDLYHHFHEYGYAVFTSCTLNNKKDPNEKTDNIDNQNNNNINIININSNNNVLDRVTKFVSQIKQKHIKDAKNQPTLELSLDPDIVKFMEFLHGNRRVFPFQTLHFPKGSQRYLHVDLLGYDTMPRTLMSAAWTALEDTNENNGPLFFYPKSHHYGIWDIDEVGMRFIVREDELKKLQKADPVKYKKIMTDEGDLGYSALYAKQLERILSDLGLEKQTAHDVKRGQTFIWAAGLAHGGSAQKDMDLTRFSQVTHYFFEGAHKYWSPRLSNPSRNQYSYRDVIPCIRNQRIPSSIFSCADLLIEEWKKTFDNVVESADNVNSEEQSMKKEM
jgi:ectoine hydroxylase-related dioxygenase (phytanoyl-CoA dioxygenase family)